MTDELDPGVAAGRVPGVGALAAAGRVGGGAVFGRFEAGDPNELWTGDALHGRRIGGRKTYLPAMRNPA